MALARRPVGLFRGLPGAEDSADGAGRGQAALGIDVALKEIEKNKGTLYDNTVVDTCLRLFREKEFHLDGA